MRRHLILSRSPRVIAALLRVAVARGGIAAWPRAFTLKLAKNAKVTNRSATTKSESIVVTLQGLTVYTLERRERRIT